jgi:C-terminal peptidase prc
MNRLIVPTLFAWVLGGSMALADGPMSEPAARAWAVTDAVLARHVDPPLRQQMVLAGVKAMVTSARVATPGGLARRVSDLSGPEQLAALLADVLAGPKVEVKAGRPTPPAFENLPPEEAFFAGLLSVVPGEATLMSAKERKVQESFQANLYVGIQVALGMDDKAKRPVFQKILEGGPAENAGAKAGDLIEEVDGASTEGMRLGGVVDRLRGAEGTDVLVRFRRPETGEVFTKPMTRGTLPRATIEGRSPLPDKRWTVRLEGQAPIGYLKVTEVSGSTPQELRAFAAQLESEGAKALVLDLRQASPAHFHQTVLLADALLDGGVIGRIKSVDGEKTYTAEPDALFRDWPMVVLAAGNHEPEIAWLCDALEDNHRATIVGEPIIPREPNYHETVALPGGEWSVRMATGRLERGDGRPIEHRPARAFAARVPAGMAPGARIAAKPDEAPREVAELTRKLDDLNAAIDEAVLRIDEDFTPEARTKLERALENLKQSPAKPGATLTPKQARERDLARAVEILEAALKSTAK